MLKARFFLNVLFSQKSRKLRNSILISLYDDRSFDTGYKLYISIIRILNPSTFRASITLPLLLYWLYVSMWKQGFQSSLEQSLCSSHYMLKSYFRTARVSLGTVCSSSSCPPMTYVHVGNFNRRYRAISLFPSLCTTVDVISGYVILYNRNRFHLSFEHLRISIVSCSCYFLFTLLLSNLKYFK